MFKFTVDRKRWCRGDIDNSKLLNSYTDKMCCLGFLSIACGLDSKDIEGKTTPEDIGYDKLPEEMKFLVKNDEYMGWVDNYIATQLMSRNDDNRYNAVEGKARERELKKQFLANNIEVEFVN